MCVCVCVCVCERERERERERRGGERERFDSGYVVCLREKGELEDGSGGGCEGGVESGE